MEMCVIEISYHMMSVVYKFYHIEKEIKDITCIIQKTLI